MGKSLAVAAAVVVIILGPQNLQDQCDDPHFARVNPGICNTLFPFPVFPGGTGSGGGGSGGILGTIGKILGGLTGGIL